MVIIFSKNYKSVLSVVLEDNFADYLKAKLIFITHVRTSAAIFIYSK